MVQFKPLLGYPKHSEFEELLSSCGSMTKQLEEKGHHLSVTLLSEAYHEEYFRRYTILNLDNIPVVVACSQTDIKNQYFHSLLKNASTTPIGKFLFAKDSKVKRESDMAIELVTINDLQDYPILTANLLSHKYQQSQQFWQRKSLFTYNSESFELIEILLPELDLLFQ
ncbi:chorismate--pyruvate lyase family protein [Aquella oligotrophica]|uniref:Chorismate lyase n=1 Tax=Aquella oligotrophica TaxID=2067065 RepID=A0A2I7N817_9NEIS|nr:hypothetical protein [Aquella oligotrophica]AUR52606.1 hypothetical protein CUN60_09965 [Aquella oligotrophica]